MLGRVMFEVGAPRLTKHNQGQQQQQQWQLIAFYHDLSVSLQVKEMHATNNKSRLDFF